jgi:predicted DNA-binding transcriptional regulator AlpA
MRKRIRRAALAELFQVGIRTIDAWVKQGTLPQPHYLPGSRVPLWFADEIDKIDSNHEQR